MNNFLKSNKLVFYGVIFSIAAIIVGLIINNAGILIGASITLSLALFEFLRKLLIHIRYNIWIRKNSGRIVINLYSDSEIEFDLTSIKQALGRKYLIVNQDYIPDKILFELAFRNYFNLNQSVLVKVSTDFIIINDIQKEYESLLNAEITLQEFLDLIESYSKQ